MSKYNPRYDAIDLLSEELDRLAQIARDEDDELCAIKLMSDDEREDAYQAARVTVYEYVDNSWLGTADGPVTVRHECPAPMAAATSWAEAMGLTVTPFKAVA